LSGTADFPPECALAFPTGQGENGLERSFRRDSLAAVMTLSPSHSTSQALIYQITSGVADAHSWERFVYLYGPQILAWCRKYGLQDADARDVTQDVLLQVLRQIERLQYDPQRRFRGWLRAVVHGAWCQWVERNQGRERGAADTAMLMVLEQTPARDELLARLEGEYDSELLELAMERIRRRVEPQTWQAFELLAVQRLSGEEGSARLGMPVGSLFAARSKVQRLLREEIARLEQTGGEA
jgi:RNA polymerase sigma factor (sigma-70 family)